MLFVGHLLVTLVLGVGVQGLVGCAGGLPEERADDVGHDRRQGYEFGDNDLEQRGLKGGTILKP